MEGSHPLNPGGDFFFAQAVYREDLNNQCKNNLSVSNSADIFSTQGRSTI